MSKGDIYTKLVFFIPTPDTFIYIYIYISMVDCLSWYSCYGKEKRPISKIQKTIQNSIIDKSKHMNLIIIDLIIILYI
jgi:hypothetical protein